MIEKWFKFFSADYLNDLKISSLTAEERSCWTTLLCYADTSDIPGEIRHMTEDVLLLKSGLFPQNENWEKTKGVIQKFHQLGMIKLNDNGMITVCNFRKRQGGALTAYERQKKHRELKRDNEMITGDNTMITDDNADDNPRREEKRREEKRIGTDDLAGGTELSETSLVPGEQGGQPVEKEKKRNWQAEACEYLRKKQELVTLDKPLRANLKSAWQALEFFGVKEDPDKAFIALCATVDFSLQDKFHAQNMTSMVYFYSNLQKILKAIGARKSKENWAEEFSI